jgi:NADH pyrophosphatase NudC (nudix superfamily)
MRQLYVANYESGSLKPSTEKEEVYWMPIKEALDKLESTVHSLMQMTKQTFDHPNTLWGASFILYRENESLKSKIEEDFYPLMEMK